MKYRFATESRMFFLSTYSNEWLENAIYILPQWADSEVILNQLKQNRRYTHYLIFQDDL